MLQLGLFSKKIIDDNPYVEEEYRKGKDKVKILDNPYNGNCMFYNNDDFFNVNSCVKMYIYK
jgi:hypothetical protein